MTFDNSIAIVNNVVVMGHTITIERFHPCNTAVLVVVGWKDYGGDPTWGPRPPPVFLSLSVSVSLTLTPTNRLIPSDRQMDSLILIPTFILP
jgi:hypothetical protein